MLLSEPKNVLVTPVNVRCDNCGAKYESNYFTAHGQMRKWGQHRCRTCTRKPRVFDTGTEYSSQDFVCGDCGKEARGKTKTIIRQTGDFGHPLCINCMHRRSGKIVGAKYREQNRQRLLDKNDPIHSQEAQERGAAKKRGRPLTEAAKQALRKPKSRTDKIKEAANRPEERARRSRRMADFVANNSYEARGIFRRCETGWLENTKTKQPIFFRSGLEKHFLDRCDNVKQIKSVESAEFLRIVYEFEGSERRYLPDFKVELHNGLVYIVEVKSPYLIKTDVLTRFKMVILKYYSLKNGYADALLTTKKEINLWLATLPDEL